MQSIDKGRRRPRKAMDDLTKLILMGNIREERRRKG